MPSLGEQSGDIACRSSVVSTEEDDEILARRLQREEVQHLRHEERNQSNASFQQEKEDMEFAIRLASMSESANLGPAERLSVLDLNREKTGEEIDLQMALQMQEQEVESTLHGQATAGAATSSNTSEDFANGRIQQLSNDPRFTNFLEETGIDINSGVSKESILDVFQAMYPSTENIDTSGALNPYANMYLQENIPRPAGAFCVTPEGMATPAGDGRHLGASDGPSPAPDLPSAAPVRQNIETTAAATSGRASDLPSTVPVRQNVEATVIASSRNAITPNSQAEASTDAPNVSQETQSRGRSRTQRRRRSGDNVRRTSSFGSEENIHETTTRCKSTGMSPYATARRRGRQRLSRAYLDDGRDTGGEKNPFGQTNFDIIDSKILATEVPQPTKQKKKGKLNFFRRKRETKEDEKKGRSQSPGLLWQKNNRKKNDQENRADSEIPSNIPNPNLRQENRTDSTTPQNVPNPNARPESPKQYAIRNIGGPRPRQVSFKRDSSRDSGRVGASGQSTQTVQRNGLVCRACGKRGGKFVVAQTDIVYHVDCFRCMSCHDLIEPTSTFALVFDPNGERQPVHHKCYQNMFGIECSVCGETITADENGSVSFLRHPFFEQEHMCRKHEINPGRRCTSCHRFEPESKPFANLNDGNRCICYACCRTVIMDNGDIQPLWEQVMDFFEEKLNLPIWNGMRDIPVLVVGEDALSDKTRNSIHGESGQMTTRGICLTEHERSSFRSPSLHFNRDSLRFEPKDDESEGFDIIDMAAVRRRRSHVSTITAILCLSGLPRDLTASILAHEATHAWIKLHPNYSVSNRIPPIVEEGVAQLMAYMLLNDGLDAPNDHDDGQGPTDAKLRQYFKFSIETDDDDIYGDGFRLAAQAYSIVGIDMLLNHIVDHKDFPEI